MGINVESESAGGRTDRAQPSGPIEIRGIEVACTDCSEIIPGPDHVCPTTIRRNVDSPRRGENARGGKARGPPNGGPPSQQNESRPCWNANL